MGESESLQRFGKEFVIIKKGEKSRQPGAFEVGDRVKGLDSGDTGVVVAVDEDGDPKVKLDGESEALQRFGKEFVIIAKGAAADPDAAADSKKRSRSRSKSKGKGKKKKKKKGSSSSSSASSKSSSSSSKSKRKKRPSAFGKSTLEMMADEKKNAKKHTKKYGKHRSSGAD